MELLCYWKMEGGGTYETLAEVDLPQPFFYRNSKIKLHQGRLSNHEC